MKDTYKIGTIIPIEFKLISTFFRDEIIDGNIFISEKVIQLKNGDEIILKNSIDKNMFYVNFHLYFHIIEEEKSKTNSLRINYQLYLDFFNKTNSKIRNLRTKSLMYPSQGSIESDIFSSPQFRKAMHVASNPKDQQIQGKKKPFSINIDCQKLNNETHDSLIKNNSNTYVEFEYNLIEKLIKEGFIKSYISDR